jgi:hypothetical protein
MRGSWNRKPPSGYEVVRIRFQNGRPVEFEQFLTGFLSKDGTGWAYTARPTGIAIDRTGALLIADDSNGAMYRVAYRAAEAMPKTALRRSALGADVERAKRKPLRPASRPPLVYAPSRAAKSFL